MPGKMCDGTNNVPSDPILSRTYCVGREAAYKTQSASDNPHSSGTPEFIAWDAGWNSAKFAAGAPLSRDCCAQRAKAQS